MSLQRRARRRARKLPFKRADVGPDDIAFLQYTGGTTGVAKGAMLLHRNMVANVLQVEAWHAPMRRRPPAIEQLIDLTALPLYHIFALTACFLFGVQQRRHLHADPQSARHRRADQGIAQEYQGQLRSRR